jgi:methionine synthase I (cobalamin-dependent)
MEAREPRTVLEELRAGQLVVCDGAMGTMLHAAGVPLDGSLPELNLSRPTLVRDLHSAYVGRSATTSWAFTGCCAPSATCSS